MSIPSQVTHNLNCPPELPSLLIFSSQFMRNSKYPQVIIPLDFLVSIHGQLATEWFSQTTILALSYLSWFVSSKLICHHPPIHSSLIYGFLPATLFLHHTLFHYYIPLLLCTFSIQSLPGVPFCFLSSSWGTPFLSAQSSP